MFPEALVEDCLIPSLGETELSGKEYRKAEKKGPESQNPFKGKH